MPSPHPQHTSPSHSLRMLTYRPRGAEETPPFPVWLLGSLVLGTSVAEAGTWQDGPACWLWVMIQPAPLREFKPTPWDWWKSDFSKAVTLTIADNEGQMGQRWEAVCRLRVRTHQSQLFQQRPPWVSERACLLPSKHIDSPPVIEEKSPGSQIHLVITLGFLWESVDIISFVCDFQKDMCPIQCSLNAPHWLSQSTVCWFFSPECVRWRKQ